MSEAVTLAQIVRLVALAGTLDPRRYEVGFASALFPDFVFEGAPFERLSLDSLSPAEVAEAVDRGRRIYDRKTLDRYVESDAGVLRSFRPDLVVGDLRWSLAVSAPLAGVPFASLANAYWSPRALSRAIPLPDHPMVRALGRRIAGACFPLAAPWVFRHFARPLNELRRAHGLPSIGGLRDILTYGDYTLYADTPNLAPTEETVETERYLGAVLWSPQGTLPTDWGTMRDRLPVYVTLGSSGDIRALPVILAALRDLAVDVLVATAGRTAPPATGGPFRYAEFVPGDQAARRAALVITNGGSSTGYQALAEGTPVLGLPHNLDQYLAMTAIEGTGAGILLRSGGLTVSEARRAVTTCLTDDRFAHAARLAARGMQALRPEATFPAFVDEALRGYHLPATA